jgi:hypothetical protein
VTLEHIEDIAALYALGALADDERAAVDAHVRHCSPCARAVGAAEEDVAIVSSTERRWEAPSELADRIGRIVQTEPRGMVRRARASWPLGAAIAAALVIGLAPSFYLWSQNRAMHDAMLAQTAAMDRVAGTAHRVAAFGAMPSGATARVVYAADGSWYVVLIRDARKPLAVAWMHEGLRTMLGSAVPHGNVAMLYLPKSHRMDRLALMDGQHVVAEATLSWQRTPLTRQAGRSS